MGKYSCCHHNGQVRLPDVTVSGFSFRPSKFFHVADSVKEYVLQLFTNLFHTEVAFTITVNVVAALPYASMGAHVRSSSQHVMIKRLGIIFTTIVNTAPANQNTKFT